MILLAINAIIILERGGILTNDNNLDTPRKKIETNPKTELVSEPQEVGQTKDYLVTMYGEDYKKVSAILGEYAKHKVMYEEPFCDFCNSPYHEDNVSPKGPTRQ